ncbi:MAG: hypothetical protein IJD43_07440 [Thermoguttaceae bacterium]|nr:hypothetical protein [Thermoguttaceae bacterium]
MVFSQSRKDFIQSRKQIPSSRLSPRDDESASAEHAAPLKSILKIDPVPFINAGALAAAFSPPVRMIGKSPFF